jgi:hypothetical protein
VEALRNRRHFEKFATHMVVDADLSLGKRRRNIIGIPWETGETFPLMLDTQATT